MVYAQDIIKQCISLYEDGYSLRKISKKMDVSASAVLNWLWKNGATPKRISDMMSHQYKEWRMSVFVRDGFTCLTCQEIGGELHAHHILAYSKYPKLRCDVDNGATLCVSCHCKIHGRKQMGKYKAIL